VAESRKTWVDDLAMVPCRAATCRRPLVFAANRVTGKEGPIDLRTTVYVLYRPAMPMVVPQCNTAKDFLSQVASITLHDGTVLRADDIRLGVSHFQTCSNAERFSKKGKT